MFLCKWDNLSNNLNKITKKTNNGEKVSIPFSLLSCIDDPSISMKSAEIYSNHRFPKTNILPKISHYHNHEKRLVINSLHQNENYLQYEPPHHP